MKIILAVDGSEHAQAAIELLKGLPLPIQSTVIILVVAPHPKSPKNAVLSKALEQSCEQLVKQGLNIEGKLLYGHPAQKIVQVADESKPDLILMGAKGLRATLGILLGGVVQQVVEHANWPVLIIRAPYHGLGKILLVLDGSPCSQNALTYFMKFPIPSEAHVSIMHVLPPPATEQEIITATWAAGVDAISIRPTIREELERAQHEEIERCNALLSQAIEACKTNNIDATTVIKTGDAATEILNYSLENSTDLIVAGSRGLSAISGWLLGSVSRKLVHYASCSVLIVKGEYCNP